LIPFFVSANISSHGPKCSDKGHRHVTKKETKDIEGGYSMRSILISIWLSAIVLAMNSSCATVPKEPLASGEIRLLSMEALGSGIKEGAAFPVNVFFEAEGRVEIKRACFYESKERQYCSDVSYITFGGKRVFQVYLPSTKAGSYRVECYVEYVQNGEIRKTNVITTQISIGY